jgi:rod shape-determining protein MreC
MEYGPPPLFNQGVSARARLGFFAFLAIVLLVIDARVKALDTIRIGMGMALYPLQQVLLLPRDVVSRVGSYFNAVSGLQRENDTLRAEAVVNAQALQQGRLIAEENAQLRRLAGMRERKARDGVLAEVKYESRDRFTRKLVIDRGERDGLRAGLPAIDDRGVVGQVTRVLPDSAEVTLLTDKDQAIPVQLARNGLRGVAFGGLDAGMLDLRFMPANADVTNGDEVYTSGLDGVYPPGLLVARVARVERDVKDQFARIVLAPAGGVQSYTVLLVLRGDPTASPPPEETPPARKPGAERRGTRR